jgi:hypothetical protein
VKLLIVAVALVLSGVAGMLLFGFPRGYEVSAYHLPIGLSFMQSGSLRPWDTAYMHAFPGNMSLLSGILLQIFPERMVSLANYPFLMLALLATFGLARSIGSDVRAALLCSCGLVSIPIVAFSAFELGADVAGMAFIGAGFYLALTAPKPISGSWSFLVGLAAGLAFGFKSLHLVGGALLGGLILVDQTKITSALKRTLCFVGGFVVMAGVWLCRNYLEYGNPLYPVHVPGMFDLLNWPRAPDIDYLSRTTELEWVRSRWEWLIYPWVEWHAIDQNFKHSSGLGAFFASTVPIAFAAATVEVVRRGFIVPAGEFSRDVHLSRTAVLLGATAVIIAVWWILVDRQPRYTMGALILAVALVGRVLTGLHGRYRRIAETIALTSIALMLVVIGTKELTQFASRMIVSRQTTRAEFYEYPIALDRLPTGAVVMNLAGRSRNYHAFGADLSNRVVTEFAVLGRFYDPDDNHDLLMLRAHALARSRVEYIYSVGDLRGKHDACTHLEEIDRLDRNPANDAPLKTPRILYRVGYCNALRLEPGTEARERGTGWGGHSPANPAGVVRPPGLHDVDGAHKEIHQTSSVDLDLPRLGQLRKLTRGCARDGSFCAAVGGAARSFLETVSEKRGSTGFGWRLSLVRGIE